MPSSGSTIWSELILALETSLVVQRAGEAYDDNYVKIGEIEVWYIDGSRTTEDGQDIADVCDSLGQMETDSAEAIYADRLHRCWRREGCRLRTFPGISSA